MSVQVQQKCYHSHPALPVGNGKVIYGGSCLTPAVTDADIYVGLDGGAAIIQPWHGAMSVYFPIHDMGTPKNEPEFKAMVGWLSNEIDRGCKVHVGCIGGHGRTGMLMAALVAHRKVDPDPIAYVRTHYCSKVVESKNQVDFLVRAWGCPPAPATKDYSSGTNTTGGSSPWSTAGRGAQKVGGPITTGEPFRVKGCMWGTHVKKA